MRIISFGTLAINYYFTNGNFLGFDCGSFNANVLINLADKYETCYLGYVGMDNQGISLLRELSKHGVDVREVMVKKQKTNINFITRGVRSNTCPYCARKKEHHNFSLENITSHILKDDLIIIDELSDDTLNILDTINNRFILNLEDLDDYIYLSLDEINSIFAERFFLIVLSDNAYKQLFNKFDVDTNDLFDLWKPQILIINKEPTGSLFVTQEGIFEKFHDTTYKIIDRTGAKEAYLAAIIDVLIRNNYCINEKILSYAYIKASANYRFLCSFYGSSSLKMRKITDYGECICEDIIVLLIKKSSATKE